MNLDEMNKSEALEYVNNANTGFIKYNNISNILYKKQYFVLNILYLILYLNILVYQKKYKFFLDITYKNIEVKKCYILVLDFYGTLLTLIF